MTNCPRITVSANSVISERRVQHRPIVDEGKEAER